MTRARKNICRVCEVVVLYNFAVLKGMCSKEMSEWKNSALLLPSELSPGQLYDLLNIDLDLA